MGRVEERKKKGRNVIIISKTEAMTMIRKSASVME